MLFLLVLNYFVSINLFLQKGEFNVLKSRFSRDHMGEKNGLGNNQGRNLLPLDLPIDDNSYFFKREDLKKITLGVSTDTPFLFTNQKGKKR